MIEFAYELIGIFIRNIDFHYLCYGQDGLGIRKVKMGGLSSGKQFTFVLFFVFVFLRFFFAAEGAVAWDIALSLEIPTVDGKRLMIPDDNISL